MSIHLPARCRCPRLTARLAALACASLSFSAAAAPGDLDPTFGVDGRVLVAFPPGIAAAHAVASMADGRIVIVGSADDAVDSDDCTVAMLHPDGALDTGFGSGGRVRLDFDPTRENVCQGVAVQSDGRIVLVGYRELGVLNARSFMVIRLLPDGTLDNSFSGDGYVSINFGLMFGSQDDGTAVALQADGRIVVAGRAQQAPGDYTMAVARLNPDGSLDTSFNGFGRAWVDIPHGAPRLDVAWDVAVQPDGRIVLAGESADSEDARMLVARLTSAGLPDGTFNLLGYRQVDFFPGTHAYARGLALRSDGSIVLGGYAGTSSQSTFAAAVVTGLGAMAADFGTDGRVLVDAQPHVADSNGAFGIELDAGGGLVLAGPVISAGNAVDMGVIRLLPGGTPDPAFGQAGRRIIAFDLAPHPNDTDVPYAMTLMPDGDIVLAGAVVVSGGPPAVAHQAVVRLQGAAAGDDTLFANGFELP